MLIWICISTHSGKELIAQENLNRQYNDRCYCPMMGTDKRLNKKDKLQALWPSYIFLRLDDEKDDFSMIRSTKGVLTGYLKTAGEPSIVPDYLIEALMNSARDEVIDYRHGNQIRIITGNFAEYLATIEKVEKKHVFAVIDGGIKITLDRTQIEPI